MHRSHGIAVGPRRPATRLADRPELSEAESLPPLLGVDDGRSTYEAWLPEHTTRIDQRPTIIIQSRRGEVAAHLSDVLEPCRYMTYTTVSDEDTVILARCVGPIDVVVRLEVDGPEAELNARLTELCPHANLIDLGTKPPVDPTAIASAITADSSTVGFEPTLIIQKIERALANQAQHGDERRDGHQLRTGLVDTVQTFLGLLERLHPGVSVQSRLVMEQSLRVAREMGLGSVHAEEVAIAALLQDIGLYAGARSNSPDEEWDRVRQHPLASAQLAQDMCMPWRVRHIILCHHEWYNGLGYPRGLKGRAIPLGARILAVVNTYQGLTSAITTENGLQQSDALAEIGNRSGTQLDPEVVELYTAFISASAFQAALPRRRILLVADDGPLAQLVQSWFADAGSEVELVSRVDSVLPTLRARSADAVLIDAALGDMSGFQVLHWLRAEASPATTAVIMLGSTTDDGVQQCLSRDLGADDLIPCGTVGPELVGRVYAVLRRCERPIAADGSLRESAIEHHAGSLMEMSVASLTQLLSEGRKTARVTLVGPDGRGLMALDQGKLVHAETNAASGDSASGELAFRQLLEWTSADYQVEHGSSTAVRTIATPVSRLLFEACVARAV